MRIVVLTQEDPFFIPHNVRLLCKEPGFDVVEIVILDRRGAVRNMKRQVLRWFGPMAVIRLGFKLILHRLLGSFRRDQSFSLHAVGRHFRIPVTIESDANAPAFVDRIAAHLPDVLVSFSAPQVFGEALLGVAAYGALNLHCSLLPDYRGLLPSFWVLHNQEERTGATVHLMDTEIDNGGIVLQREVPIAGYRSMHQVLTDTKRVGGELMLEALRDLRDGKMKTTVNPSTEGRYFSWPTDEDVRRFRRLGYRLI